MLEMDEGRLSFPEALRPPEGYRTSFAVGTTYTLDLRALLGLCIPLGLGFEPESLAYINPVSLFAALQELQDKIVIYCDKGHISADIGGDSRSSSLAILLENMIHQVHVHKRSADGLASFHPKVWVVEYEPIEPGEQNLYRLIVMSRNLTFDTSWDVAISIDGHPGIGDDCANNVAAFLDFLALGDSYTDTEKDNMRKRGSHSARVQQLAEAISHVDFELDENYFTAVEFLPIGPVADNQNILLDAESIYLLNDKYRNLLVVSPFLSNAARSPLQTFLEHRSGQNGKYILISRDDSLEKLSDDLKESYECYSPVSWLSSVELEGEDGPIAADYSDLHAKIYYAEEPNSQRHLYVGSLNASRNGTINNVEALLHLYVKSHRLTFDQIVKSFIGDEKTKGAFAPYSPGTSTGVADERDQRFRRIFQASVKTVDFKAVNVVRQGDRLFLNVECELKKAAKESRGISYRMRPLLSASWKDIGISPNGGREHLTFGPLKIEQISALFIVEGYDDEGHGASCILCCPHDLFHDEEADFDTRSSALLDSILASNENALALYITHAFRLPEAEYAGDPTGADAPSHGAARHRTPIPPGLYERLLRMAYSNPDAIAQAKYLIDLIPDGVDDDEVQALKDLIKTFMTAVGR